MIEVDKSKEEKKRKRWKVLWSDNKKINLNKKYEFLFWLIILVYIRKNDIFFSQEIMSFINNKIIKIFIYYHKLDMR